MPVYKDEAKGTWFVKCYYTDYTGVKRQRKKRGFKRRNGNEIFLLLCSMTELQPSEV